MALSARSVKTSPCDISCKWEVAVLYKEQDVIIQTAKTLNNIGYMVITFDCRNSRGKSFNNRSCASMSSMYADLWAVISWAKEQSFYTEPFLLGGHSLGGSVVLNYAEKYLQSVSNLILISAIFDGNELYQNTAKSAPEFMQQLQNAGVIRTQDGVDCFLDCTYLNDLQQYDLYKNVTNLAMPTLIITGDNDTASLPENNQRFYKCLLCLKELHVLGNCLHIYDTEENKKDLDEKIRTFLYSSNLHNKKYII